jgi:uncharacterized protein (TIGR02302 family)
MERAMTVTDPKTALRRIDGPVRLTLLGLWAERLTRSLWPLWSVIFAVLSVLAFGIQDNLSLEIFWGGSVLACLATLWSVVYAVRIFRRPSRAEAEARLDSRLPGRPIAALHDNQAIGNADPASRAVWEAHRARMAERAAQARPVAPDLRLAARDPFALRYVALTALAMALMFGSIWRVSSATAMMPGSAQAIAEAGPSWEGWAQPPLYTGKPALYLNDVPPGELPLPVGTRIQTRFYGESGALTLAETVSQRTDLVAASELTQDFTIRQSGQVAINGSNGREWKIIAIPDQRPTIAAEGAIGREADGRLKQRFRAADDYGVTSGKASFALDLGKVDRRFGLSAEPEPRAPVVLDLPMPMTGRRDAFQETLIDDLSEHAFANLPVTMVLTATDAAPQDSSAAPVELTLPGKRFFDPLAAAVIEMRRDLLWSRQNAPRTVQILKAITNRPQEMIRSQRAYLRLRVAIRQLDAQQRDMTSEQRDTLAKEFWQIALLIEEGDLQSAFDRLQRAQDRLDEAIRNGASQEEIDQLMQDMRQALNEYMRQLAQEAQRNPQGQSAQNMDGMQMSGDQLKQMLDELQRLMQEGKTAEAAALMEMLRQGMQNGDPNGQQNGEGEGSAEGEGSGGGQSFADRQRALRERLDGLNNRNMLPGPGTESGQAGRRQLDEAGRAMDEAEQALRDGDLSSALDRQAEAMEALRDGMRHFGEAMAQDERKSGNNGQRDQRMGQADPLGQRDPLGRGPDNAARQGSDHNMLQNQDVYRRAQDLLDEIRRRSGEQQRPDTERNYLRRLLELF